MTPGQRHYGRDRDLLERRHALYQAAREKHPERWSGKTRNWTKVDEVFLNPEKATRPVTNKIQTSSRRLE